MTLRRHKFQLLGIIPLGDTKRVEIRKDPDGNIDLRLAHKSYGPWWNTGKAGFVVPRELIGELIILLAKATSSGS